MFSKEDFSDSKTVHFVDFSSMGVEETKKRVAAGDYYGALFIPAIDSLEILANSIEFYSKESPGISVMNALESKLKPNFEIVNSQIWALIWIKFFLQKSKPISKCLIFLEKNPRN